MRFDGRRRFLMPGLPGTVRKEAPAQLSSRPGSGYEAVPPPSIAAATIRLAAPTAGSPRQCTAGRSLTTCEDGSASSPGAAVVATVKWYDPVKGYGFLTPADGSRDLFCHTSAVSRAGWDTLPECATVSCEVEQGRQGPQVRRIHAVDVSTASPGSAESGRPLRGQHGHGYGERVASSARRVVATVKWFVPSRGFGLLIPSDSSPDVFCHVSVVEEAGYGTLRPGGTVTCEETEGRRGPVVASTLAVDASTGTYSCTVACSTARASAAWRRAST